MDTLATSARVAALALLIVATACDAPRAMAPSPSPDAQLSRLGRDDHESDDKHLVLPLGRFSADEDDSCKGVPYRAFDFWRGSWNAVETGTTNLVGTNVITATLKGCTIEEHWIGADGNRGRSLNAYDASTREWNQLWMDQTGGALVFAGTGLPRGMSMDGTHRRNRLDPTLLMDRVTWTALSSSSVRQVGLLSTAGGPFEPVYDITYNKTSLPASITPSGMEFCSAPTRPRFHAFDFLLGQWTVRSPASRKAMTSVVSTDLGGCLVEERMHGPGGYEAVAYSGFRSATFVWNWMFMDNQGVQLRLSGPATLTGTNMIMLGTRTDQHGVMTNVRVEWVMTDASTVEQRWSFSIDAGATWTTPSIVTMTR
ncbi:MAG: hypothetical protein ABI120_09190 [Gemmatimonadaceae bacterium]